MSEPTIRIDAVLMTQAAGQVLLAAVLAITFGRFYGAYRRAYLRHWAQSWLALVIHFAGAVLSRHDLPSPSFDLATVALAAGAVAGYFQIAWLLLGVWELAREADAPAPLVHRVLGVSAAIALGPLLLPSLGRHSSVFGLYGLLAGLACLTGALLLGAPRVTRPHRGFAGIALGTYAAAELGYFALALRPSSRQVRELPLVLTLHLAAMALLGFALVVWMLERERARLARAGDLGRRRERAQACVYAISEATRKVKDLPQLYRSIHEILQEVLPARNFFVALADRSTGLLSFPHFVDEASSTPPPRPLGRGLTEYVLRSGRPLLATPEIYRELQARGDLEAGEAGCVDWLGAPLVSQGETIGVAAILTHDASVRFGPGERDLFIFVSEQIAAAIEAKRAEEALRESQARLRMMVEQVPAALWTTDDQLRVTTLLGAGLRALGLAPKQLAGVPPGEPLAPDDVWSSWHRQALAGTAVSGDCEKAGRSFIVHLEPLRDAAAIRGVIGIALDVSEKRDADRALRESEVRLRQVIDLVPHFIFAKDEAGRFLLANHAVAEAYGTGVAQLIGRSDADFNRSPEEIARFREDDLAVIRSGRPKVIPEERITDSDGHLRYLQTTKIPFTSSGARRPAVLGVSIDITERKAVEEAVRRAAKEESLSVLAGGVAHDFNNLLAAILGHASLALDELPDGAARHHVERAAAAAERASDLTRQMLAYSGRGHFVVRSTDVNALVRENLPLLEVGVPKNVRLEARLHEELPPIDADVGQIQQVLMNLVINAAEAIGARGGTVTVATGVRDVGPEDASLWRASGQPLASGKYVWIEVRDDGPGMAPETLDRIFEPFFSTKAAGRGLGLAAVLGVVRGHRAGLSVDSTPGRGTAFRLLFLAVAGPSPEPPSSEAAARPPGSLRILLIDDEEVVRDMVGEVLRAEGFEVRVAADGEAGVRIFEESADEIDVVLLDLSMPGLSGEATYSRLVRIRPEVRVILSSGYDHQEALRRFGRRGPVGFIQKPYRPPELLSEIGRCLGFRA